MSSKYVNSTEPLKRSKSLCSLSENVTTSGRDNRSRNRGNQSCAVNNSSMEIKVAVSDSYVEEGVKQDSGISDKTFGDELHDLDQKIDRISDMLSEQYQLLTTLKEDLQNSKDIVEKVEVEQSEMISELVLKAVGQSDLAQGGEEKSRAKCLLDAIESSQGSVDSEICDILVGFLQSEELKERMVRATAESVKDVIGSCMSRDVSALYLPILERSHRRLLRHVARVIEEAFNELEEYSSRMTKTVYKISRSLHRAIERHRSLLEATADPQKNILNMLRCTVDELLSTELKQWRQKVLDTFTVPVEKPVEDFPDPPNLDLESTSPPRSADPEWNIIDELVPGPNPFTTDTTNTRPQVPGGTGIGSVDDGRQNHPGARGTKNPRARLIPRQTTQMVAVEISQQIERGEVNGAFERALSAYDLSLVMTACRGAAGCNVFAPHCRLRQHVLLALLQQLSTDMLYDTSLKCRYLEDAIINLDTANPATRSHLPLVVGEVHKHLSKFLASYPGHVANKRVSLIIMAADNLLK